MTAIKYTGENDRRGRSKVVRFDPTIHAGHVMTAITMILCSIGAWYDVKNSVASLKEENSRQNAAIEVLDKSRKDKEKEMSEQILASGLMNNRNVEKIRDDMNEWFIRINDKLDQKQDKRYK